MSAPLTDYNSAPPSPSDEHPWPNSALYDALLECTRSVEAASAERIDLLAEVNNPRRQPDGALYWVDNNGKPLRFKFPALVDLEGQFSQLDPYFNFDGAKSINIPELRRARAQFELRPLSDDLGPDYPQEAISCSVMALNTLFVLCNELEEKRNKGVDEKKQPELTQFWRTYGPSEGDRFVFVVTTSLLFKDLPDPNRPAGPRMTRADIAKTSVLLSPSKVKPARKSLGRTSESDQSGMTISDMADPRGLYAGINMPDAVITPPNVRDKDGTIVQPAKYSTAFEHLTPVSVEVILKLWEIIPKQKNNTQVSNKPVSRKDEFGARIYQIIVEKMEVLPQLKDRNREPLTPTMDKGKRKARDEHEEASPAKKASTSRDDDVFMD